MCVWFPEWENERSDDPTRLLAAVEKMEKVVARVEVAEPWLFFLPAAGAARFYGGERELVEAMARALGPGARLGVADGPFAACWAARLSPTPIVEDTVAFLAGLEVEALGVEELAATLRWLGITTLGELARLPPEAVASRFGATGIVAHRLARGEDRRLHPRSIPPDLAVTSDHADDPLISIEQVAFIGRQLAIRLLEAIAPSLCYQVAIEIETEAGESRRRWWRSLVPFTDSSLSERVRWQMAAWMEGGAVTRIRLQPGELSDRGRQLSWADGWWRGEGSERALTRVQTLLGAEAVLHPSRVGGRLPSEQVEWARWGEEASSRDTPSFPGQTPPPSPALVSERPPPLEVEWDEGVPSRVRLGSRWETVLSWSGPWRLVGRWWQGQPSVDRYQIVTSVGAVLCVVAEGRAYLVGVYD